MRGDPGFTLLEVLVAFVIAALALGALYQGSTTGLRTARVSADDQEAISRARSHLAALLAQDFVPGTQTGDDGGGFSWTTRETLAGTAAQAKGGSHGTPVLYALQVTISWTSDGGARFVTLHSAKLASLPAQTP